MTRPAHLPSLDGIRAICIVMVHGAHAARADGFPAGWVWPSRFVFNDALGVRVFFVLSGFLITYLLAREEDRTRTVSLANFYARRCVRILPVFFMYLATVAGLDLLTPLEVRPCQYLTAATFTKNYACRSWIDTHLWSLSVEEQFYLLWPLVFACAPDRWRWATAATLIVTAPVCRWWFHTAGWGELRHYSFPTNMDALMIGAAAAMAVGSRSWWVGAVVVWRPWVGRLVAVTAVYVVWMSQLHGMAERLTMPIGPTVQALAAAYLITSYALGPGGAVYRVLNLRPVRYLGVLSYSIYIWQQPFFSHPSIFGAESVTVLTFPVNVLASLFVAAASYHLLEKPLLRMRQRFRTEAHPSSGPDKTPEMPNGKPPVGKE